MATPKRKYSFGLMSRLGIIGLFIGLGTWAVFNSKFKESDPEEVAKLDEEGNEEEDKEKGDKELEDESKSKPKLEDGGENKTVLPSNNSKARPASFVDDSKKNKVKKKRDTSNKAPGSSSSPGSSSKFSSSKKKSSSAPPPSFSFGDTNKSTGGGSSGSGSSGGGFKPPGSGGFSPGKSSKSFGGSDTKKSNAKSKSSPPSAIDPTLLSKRSSKSDTKKKKSAPPSSFSFSGSDGKKPSSSFSPSSGIPSSSFSPGKSSTKKSSQTKSSTGKSAKQDPVNSGSGFLAKNKSGSTGGSGGPPSSSFSLNSSKGNTKSSGPPSNTFDPRGNFQPSGNSGNSGFAAKSTPTNRNAGSGGFQSKSSDGSERPLRGGGSRPGNSITSGPPKSSFSLSNTTPNNNRPSNNPSTKSFSGTNSKQNPANSRPPTSFAGGSAFQDRGSKPLPKNNVPKSNSLNKSKGNSGIGSSSTGFADIRKTGQPKPNASTNLDPSNLKGTPNRSRNAPSNSFAGNSRRDNNSRENSRTRSLPNNASGRGNGASGITPSKFAANPNFDGAIQSGVNDRKPGPSSLEGIQAPAVTLQKFSPREIQVNVESEFQLVVRNVGRATATNILIVDPIPDGTQFVRANPAPTERGTDGSLIWKIGSLSPNKQQVINVTLLPKRQGEIGSVARMSFQAAATAKAICTKPELTITHTGPQKILMGQNGRYLVTVRNNGDGVAKNVVIEDEVPVGFAFGNGKGSRLAYELGNLPPGGRREVQLNLRAVEPGRYVNEIRVKMGKTMASNHKLDLEVVAPKLKMEIVGPTRRYYNREAKYSIEVQNSGTASAKNVLMVTRLPKGLRFVRTNNRGQYNPREHSVYWSMVELSPQNKGSVELTLLPLGTGQQEIEFESRSLLSRTDLKKFPVIVDQLAELFFEVDDRDDPIEVNGETEYRIRVVNQGSKAATNVQINVEMPVGIQATNTDGPTKGSLAGQKVKFAPIATLAPRGELIYRIKARGVRDGNHLIKVLLSSNERREAVAKQESTKVYSEYR